MKTCRSSGGWMKGVPRAAALALGLVVLLPKTAHAYIDPGMGAFLWQSVVASLVGVYFMFRHTVAGAIRRFVRRLSGSRSSDPSAGHKP